MPRHAFRCGAQPEKLYKRIPSVAPHGGLEDRIRAPGAGGERSGGRVGSRLAADIHSRVEGWRGASVRCMVATPGNCQGYYN
eukprot:352985-Chlamydomonas_euryale.AAC.2